MESILIVMVTLILTVAAAIFVKVYFIDRDNKNKIK